MMQVKFPPSIVDASLKPAFFKDFQSSESTDPPSQSLFKDQSEREIGNKRRALVVDDVADVTEMLSVILTHAGYDVVTANSAMMAIGIVKNNSFDVIISDIGMPQMNGYELAQSVRNIPGYESVLMVALTGYSKFDDRQRSLDAGFNAHLTKPIEPRELLDLIEQL
jgi:CheY-like chemotaxis protein